MAVVDMEMNGAFALRCRQAADAMAGIRPSTLQGRVVDVSSRRIEIAGLSHHLRLGDRISLGDRDDAAAAAEVVGFRDGRVLAIPFGDLSGVGLGAPVFAALHRRQAGLRVSPAWLGRVLDPLGGALDGKGPLPDGAHPCALRATPPPAARRARLGRSIDLGVAALNLFIPCQTGQRLGLFAASGVGKSTLLAMLARNMQCDVAVIALVGERGREVREFLEDDLGSAGLARSVVVLATSDTGPLMRREAAYAAMTIAEYFRDAGKSVLLVMDSVTRFCFALREIALSSGEPPATRGYPPSVFGELPKLLERAGPGVDEPGMGAISAIFTVLVEGDDHDEPVADAVRGTLDGHVILDRRIGERGRYPAVDVLRSLSRTAAHCVSSDQFRLAARARRILSVHAESADLVRLGAYRPGSDPSIDEAIAFAPRLEALLRQGRDERVTIDESFTALAEAIGTA